MEKENQLSLNFYNSINNLGRYTSIIALFFMFLIPLGATIYFDLDVSFNQVIVASSSLIAMFLPTAIVENISYYPVLGAGGIYLSCITGNVMNMKLPCAISGMKIAEVEPGSEEGDVISIICVGVSSLVTTLIVFLGMFVLGQALLPILNSEVLAPGFNNITPAILGAVAIPSLLNNKKLSIVPIVLAVGAYLVIGPARFPFVQSYVLIVVMILSVLYGYMMYKSGKSVK